MSHDIEAAWVAAEIAKNIGSSAGDYILNPPSAGSYSVYAGRESRASWPIADGIIYIDTSVRSYTVAVEYKRFEEGSHGILTAIGQSIAYLHKGHNSAVIVLPKRYDSHNYAEEYLCPVLEDVGREPIGVFIYEEPDPGKISPFTNRLDCLRKFSLETQRPSGAPPKLRVHTQWAHLREGSSTADSFYKYLLTARTVTDSTPEPSARRVNPGLVNAVQRIEPNADVVKYLSNASGINFHDKVWRIFWFRYVFHRKSMPIWSSGPSPYTTNREPTLLIQADGSSKAEFWSAKSDSIKNRLVNQLNSSQINVNQALEIYVQNVRNRAHSFREDIDSGLAHLGFLDNDGRPTSLGHRFIDVCDRTGTANSGMALSIMRAALVQNGQYGALLHYIHRLSDSLFSNNPLAFANVVDGVRGRRITFDQVGYINWVEDKLANQLRVMRKVSSRGGSARGTARKPLQAELTILGQLGLIPLRQHRFRLGTGLVINWPAVQEAMGFSV